ncbi:MAG: PDZ domain-containing protein [Planctomycetota bacterium]|jgi:hypothetical protein
MKTAIVRLIGLAVLFSTGVAVQAETESADERPFMGVLIDPAPLPGLLGKHLGLAEGQGLRIQNVQKDSPAGKAGLERDDLIVGFRGKDVRDYEQFVGAIREAGSGTEISLQIIHLGVRKTVKLTLKPFSGEPDWKYPREPDAVQSWRPGRFFRLEPGDEDWKEMFKDGIPSDMDVAVKRFFNKVIIHHCSKGKDYTVTIQGNPNDDYSTITVRDGDEDCTTTVKEIDKLPEKYRQAAEDSLEMARKTSKNRKFDGVVPPLPWWTQPGRRAFLDKLNPRNYAPGPFDRGEEMFERIQDQMREMRKRLEELEERHGEILDRLSGERDEKKSKKKESVQPLGGGEQRI